VRWLTLLLLLILHTQIHPKYLAPVNAIYVTALFSFLLSLIYIGSETAFYAITSLFTVALLQCYMFSIGSILWRRIYLPDTIPRSSLSLGRWGIAINSFALIWCMWSFVSPNTTNHRTPELTQHHSSGLSGRKLHPSQRMASTGHPSSLWASSSSRPFITLWKAERTITARLSW
jgi:amino acid transporter